MREIAELLLKYQAVSLSPDQPYTWASGIRSPIYCDNRLLLSYPEARTRVAEALAARIHQSFPDVQMLMGTATAGIPHAALVADRLKLPMGFVRAKSKDHGKNNAIEGVIHEGQRVVVVEDLVSTGGSSLAVVDTLQEAGVEVIGLVSIFTYGLQEAKQAFEARPALVFYPLTTFEELIAVAQQQGLIQQQHLPILERFMQNPRGAYGEA